MISILVYASRFRLGEGVGVVWNGQLNHVVEKARENHHDGSTQLEIPGRLYMFVQQALDLDKQLLQTRGTNFPVALDMQDGVTAKLKIENPSLDTSIRQDGVTAKLKTENPSLDTSIRILYLNKVTNEGIAKKSLESWKVSQRKADYLFKLRFVARKISSTQLEIPGRLYMFIQQALDLDKQLLQTSNSLEDLRSELKDVNLIIADFT
ncbi:hypothetical protein Tco_1170891 [Tanacetum coccineum]